MVTDEICKIVQSSSNPRVAVSGRRRWTLWEVAVKQQIKLRSPVLRKPFWLLLFVVAYFSFPPDFTQKTNLETLEVLSEC